MKCRHALALVLFVSFRLIACGTEQPHVGADNVAHLTENPVVEDVRLVDSFDRSEFPCEQGVGAWRLGGNVSHEGTKLVVDVPTGKADATASAPVDLSRFPKGFEARIRCSGMDVSNPPEHWLGLKFMVHYKDAAGTDQWPQASKVSGTFDELELRFAHRYPAGLKNGKGELVVGLQSASGRLVFDLSSLRIAPIVDFVPPASNANDRCLYTPAVRTAPRRRGVMLSERPVVEDDFRTLRSWGATLVRYQMVRNWGAENDNCDLAEYNAWLDGKLDQLDKTVLPLAEKYGLSVVVDHHVVPGGRRSGDMNMFYEPEYAEAFVSCWRKIARRFKGRKNIYGYDLVNEPCQSLRSAPNCSWWDLQRRAAEAVREVDSDVTIVLESNNWDSPATYAYMSPLAMTNVVYEVHMYHPDMFTHQQLCPERPASKWPDPAKGWTKKLIRETLAPVRAFERRHGAKIYVGEFSVVAWAEGADRYLRDCIEVFEEYGWGWSYHAFREFAGWSVEHESDRPGSYRPSSDNPRKRVLLDGFRRACELQVGQPSERFVDEFDLSEFPCGQGKRVLANKSVDGHPLTVGGVTYEHGFGARPESVVAFTANGGPLSFSAKVAIDDDAAKAGSGKSYGQPMATFSVWADGKVVWHSGYVKLGQKPVEAEVKLDGAKEIVLETSGGAQWTALDAANADWLDARFALGEGTQVAPLVDPARFLQPGILTPPEREEPQINGADIFGVRPGHPVIFRVATSGVRPMRFTAKGLPEGVTLDGANGVLRGTAPLKAGDYDVVVTAENAKGRATRTIRLAVGEKIALTPPMGWNSWNVWENRLTQANALASAKAMDRSGLGDHGWSYVNLDDFWEMNNEKCPPERPELKGPARNADGTIRPNPSFPDMKDLTDAIHALGFKAGLYSSPGRVTCGSCTGSLGHEMQDATSWAEWGFDYVKYDWCSYWEVFSKETGGRNMWDQACYDDLAIRESYVKPYRLMGECLKKQKRVILFSLCQYGMAHVEDWGASVGANCWRSWEDLKDSWHWLELAIESRIGAHYEKYSRPGCWADPDMMIVGRQFSFGSDHPTFLTPAEQYTHVTLWAMVGAPMLVGCDLAELDAFTRNLLVNDEVIAISQDRLGKVARRIRHTDAESVWVRNLANGDIAVALVNRAPISHEIRVDFAAVGLEGVHYLRDCWTQRCEGRHAGFYVAEVPPHGVKLIRVKAKNCQKCDDEELDGAAIGIRDPRTSRESQAGYYPCIAPACRSHGCHVVVTVPSADATHYRVDCVDAGDERMTIRDSRLFTL